jgi:hypothetical protein
VADEHSISVISEKRGSGANARVRYRGRCSCSHTTFMHYSTPDAARTALERTHIASLTLNERQDA